MSTSLDDVGEVFSALADPSRRAVLERLAAEGAGTATTLAARLPISRQAVVKHLAQLDRARLVTSQKIGREVIYQPQPERLRSAAHKIEAVTVDWDRTLTTLKRIAEES